MYADDTTEYASDISPPVLEYIRESSFNMTRGWMKILKREALNFSSPPRKRFNFFRVPLPLFLVLKCTNFWSPPFGCLNIFGAPLNILIPSPPLVILNELSLVNFDLHVLSTWLRQNYQEINAYQAMAIGHVPCRYDFTGPAEQFLKCGGRTGLFNCEEGLILKMVFIGTVIRTASCSWRLYSLQITFHFWKVILLSLSFFPQKWGWGRGGEGGLGLSPCVGAITIQRNPPRGNVRIQKLIAKHIFECFEKRKEKDGKSKYCRT